MTVRLEFQKDISQAGFVRKADAQQELSATRSYLPEQPSDNPHQPILETSEELTLDMLSGTTYPSRFILRHPPSPENN